MDTCPSDMSQIAQHWQHVNEGPIEIADSPPRPSNPANVQPVKQPGAAATAGIPLVTESGDIAGSEASGLACNSLLRRAKAYDGED